MKHPLRHKINPIPFIISSKILSPFYHIISFIPIPKKSSLVFESSSEPVPCKIFGLSMARADQLRLLDAPTNLRAAIRTMLEAEWEKGIQEEEGWQFAIYFRADL